MLGDETGLLKILFNPDTLKLLGVHIIGDRAAEIVHIGQAVLTMGGTIEYFPRHGLQLSDAGGSLQSSRARRVQQNLILSSRNRPDNDERFLPRHNRLRQQGCREVRATNLLRRRRIAGRGGAVACRGLGWCRAAWGSEPRSRSRTERRVGWPWTSTVTSLPTWARVRKCWGRITRIIFITRQ